MLRGPTKPPILAIILLLSIGILPLLYLLFSEVEKNRLLVFSFSIIILILALGIWKSHSYWKIYFYELFRKTNVASTYGGTWYRSAIEYPTHREAENVASERRSSLTSFLETQEGLPRVEFIERMPETEGHGDIAIESLLGRYMHSIYLEYQLEDSRFLLGARVMDALQHFVWENPSIEVPWHAVILDRIPRTEATNKFPWRAIIETAYSEKIDAFLKGYADWLGIGVDYALPKENRLFRVSRGRRSMNLLIQPRRVH